MTLLTIPITVVNLNFDFDISLDGVLYNFALYWNSRDPGWELTISNGGVFQLNGLRVVCASNILSQYNYNKLLPQGSLNIVDLDGLGRDPDNIIFGDRVIMQYSS